MAKTWTTSDPRWLALTPHQRAAAMSLMEADGARFDDARNVLGAIMNRSQRTGEPLGAHVSRAIYQPAIEPAQRARLDRILRMPAFSTLTELAREREAGRVPDWVNGATHFLAPEKTMVSLHRSNPDKYHNWGPLPNSRGRPGANWTGYDPKTGEYKGVVFRDGSHAFLSPDGKPNPQMLAKAIAQPSGEAPTQVADASFERPPTTPPPGGDTPDAHLPTTPPTQVVSAAPPPAPVAPPPADSAAPAAQQQTPTMDAIIAAMGEAQDAFAPKPRQVVYQPPPVNITPPRMTVAHAGMTPIATLVPKRA